MRSYSFFVRPTHPVFSRVNLYAQSVIGMTERSAVKNLSKSLPDQQSFLGECQLTRDRLCQVLKPHLLVLFRTYTSSNKIGYAVGFREAILGVSLFG